MEMVPRENKGLIGNDHMSSETKTKESKFMRSNLETFCKSDHSLSHADDTILLVESSHDLKLLVMKVKIKKKCQSRTGVEHWKDQKS